MTFGGCTSAFLVLPIDLACFSRDCNHGVQRSVGIYFGKVIFSGVGNDIGDEFESGDDREVAIQIEGGFGIGGRTDKTRDFKQMTKSFFFLLEPFDLVYT